MIDTSVEGLARQAEGQVLDRVLREGQPLVIVDSPPGAGKTRLVETVAATAAQHLGLRVAIVAPRVEQTYELVRRLSVGFHQLPLQLLQSGRRPPPADIQQMARVVDDARQLSGGAGVIVANSSKMMIETAKFGAGAFGLIVGDEAYQIPFKDYQPLFSLCDQHLLVGDPGQLPPLIQADVAFFEPARYKVHWPTPRELLRRFPTTPVIRLPVSRRLVPDTVAFVQPGFYPNLPFVSAAEPGRQLRLVHPGIGDPVDAALDMIAGGGSMVALLLPLRSVSVDEVDDDVAALAARVAVRVLERGAVDGAGNDLLPADIGCADSHVASGSSIRNHIGSAGVSMNDLMVNTPEIWQGLQRQIMVVKHPLSGLARPDRFSLEPGRFCVMLSRHKIGCIVVGRAGVTEALDRHHHDCANRPLGSGDEEWRGWAAHHALWSALERSGRLLHIDAG